MRLLCAWTSARLKDRRARFVDAGRVAMQSPGRHSVAGRMGRGVKPPPQFGHTFFSVFSTQSAQNVHSYEQMRARVDAGGKSLSQHSQLGRSSSAMRHGLRCRIQLQLSQVGGKRNAANPTKSDTPCDVGPLIRLRFICRILRNRWPDRLKVSSDPNHGQP
jgi:hypothetical protein